MRPIGMRGRGWHRSGLGRVVAAVSLAAALPVAAASLEETVEQVSADAAVARITPPDRFEVASSRFAGADPLPDGTLRLEPLSVEGPDPSGCVRVRLRALVGGVPAGEARATVRGVIRGRAVVSRLTLPRGKPIPPGSVEVAEVDLTGLQGSPLREISETSGRVPDRTLGAGRVLTHTVLEAEPVVRKGQSVELRIVRGSFTARARGTVRQDGAPGDLVRAQNAATGVLLVGRVEADGTLLVVRRASESPRPRRRS